MNIGLSSDNDIQIVDGNLPLVTGIEEIRQLTLQTLTAFEGDWFLDLDSGMPYFQTILQKATSISQIEGIYLDVISTIPGILDIESFNLSFTASTRQASISFRARTTDGVLDFNTDEAA
jgi:hypothetical protein